MFGFSSDIPLHAYKNQLVWWSCFSASGAKLVFENDNSVIIYNFDEYCDRNDLNKYQMAEKIIKLVGSTVCGVAILDNSAIFDFDNGVELRFQEEEFDLENYCFTINGVEYIV